VFPKTYSLVPGFLAVALAFAAVPTPAFAQSAPTASAQAAAPKQIVLRLKDNTLLMGHIVREDADVIVFSAGALGELTIKKADVEGQLEPATVAAAFQAPAPPAPPPSNLGAFAPAGKVVYTRVLGAQGTYITSPYVLGELDPRYPGLTGAALRLPGVVYSVQSQLSLYRTSDRDIVSFDASMTYAYADNAGEQADNPRVSLGYNRRIGTNDMKRCCSVAARWKCSR
jgi:hypothetical protein